MIGDRTIELYSIDSTNAYLKRNYKNFPSETVVIAKKQTEGYGRRGNNWVSNYGGLWYSVLFKPLKRPMNPWHYVRIFSLAIYDTLEKYNIKANKIITVPNTPSRKIFNIDNINGEIVDTYKEDFLIFYSR